MTPELIHIEGKKERRSPIGSEIRAFAEAVWEMLRRYAKLKWLHNPFLSLKILKIKDVI